MQFTKKRWQKLAGIISEQSCVVSGTPKVSLEKAKEIGNKIGINWEEVNPKEFFMGLKVELEHGSKFGSKTNITNDNLIKTGKIALAHLLELPDYYSRLKKMETHE